MDLLILLILAGLAIGAVYLRDLLGAAAVLGAYSLMMAVLWCRMNAVDVAFTEAAVGAGISTVLLLAAISRIGRTEKLPTRLIPGRPSPAATRLAAILTCVVTAAALLYGAQDMPEVGSPTSPAYEHEGVARHYLEDSFEEVGPPNVVTSVLGDYRGYDTMGETVVIFTAALCVILLLREAQSVGRRRRARDREAGPELPSLDDQALSGSRERSEPEGWSAVRGDGP